MQSTTASRHFTAGSIPQQETHMECFVLFNISGSRPVAFGMFCGPLTPLIGICRFLFQKLFLRGKSGSLWPPSVYSMRWVCGRLENFPNGGHSESGLGGRLYRVAVYHEALLVQSRTSLHQQTTLDTRYSIPFLATFSSPRASFRCPL